MASKLRKFGTVISGNCQKNHELSPHVRAGICAAVATGQSQRTVANAFKVSRGAVQATL